MPIMIDQLSGQVIQKLGMAGLIARETKVARGGDESPSKMMLPDAVSQNTPG